MIGSEDTRRGSIYGISYTRPEKRLKFQGLDGKLAIEGYYLFTKGGGFENIPVNNMRSYGILATAKYPLSWFPRFGSHFDLSFGLVYNSITTRDLDSNLNTTPGFGIGFEYRNIDFTVRWYHASNGGTNGNNQGTNQIQYVLSLKF